MTLNFNLTNMLKKEYGIRGDVADVVNHILEPLNITDREQIDLREDYPNKGLSKINIKRDKIDGSISLDRELEAANTFPANKIVSASFDIVDDNFIASFGSYGSGAKCGIYNIKDSSIWLFNYYFDGDSPKVLAEFFSNECLGTMLPKKSVFKHRAQTNGKPTNDEIKEILNFLTKFSIAYTNGTLKDTNSRSRVNSSMMFEFPFDGSPHDFTQFFLSHRGNYSELINTILGSTETSDKKLNNKK